MRFLCWIASCKMVRTVSHAAAMPPPGLEDWTMPAKVEIGESLRLCARRSNEEEVAVPRYAPQCSTHGEWVKAVMATAPYLNAQELQQALQILDCAISNVQQAKALDSMIARVCTAAVGRTSALPATVPQLVAAELMRQQVFEQQQLLLAQLHSLKLRAALSRSSGGRGLDLGLLRSSAGGERPGGAAAPAPRGGAAAEQEAATKSLGTKSGDAADRVLGALGHPPRRDMAGGASAGGASAGGGGRHAALEGLKVGNEQSARSSVRQVQTLSSSLQMLANEDPDYLFIVRRINKLGFKACRKLKQHFSAYGPVVRVLVAHSTVRQHGVPQCHVRRRPSSLGFVHMASPEAVWAVLATGEDHCVDGSCIRVQRFERQQAEALEQEEYGEGEDDGPRRQQSCLSTASTNMSFEEGKMQEWDRHDSGTSTAYAAGSTEESESAQAESTGADEE